MKYAVSARHAPDGAAWQDLVRRVDDLGFDAIRVADHIGMIDPFSALGAAAAASERLQLGTYVANVGFWNPLVLARSAATLALVSGGRFTLGLGAGHAELEYRAAGLPYPPAGERVTTLERVVPVLRRLLDGETVSDADLGMRDATVGFDLPPVPLLVGGNGDRVLALAGGHADVAGLVGFTSGTGQVHSDLSHWSWAGLEDRIAHVRRAAAQRAAVVSIDVLVQHVEVTDAADDASPFVLVGATAAIRDQIERLEGLGVDGITVFESSADALASALR